MKTYAKPLFESKTLALKRKVPLPTVLVHTKLWMEPTMVVAPSCSIDG